MCSRPVRQWELFSCLPSISCGVIIVFFSLFTLKAKYCLVSDLQIERKQRTVWAGEWVFPHSSGMEPQHRLSAVSRLCTRRQESALFLALSQALETYFPAAWKLRGSLSPFSSRGHNGDVLTCHFTARSMWALFLQNKGIKLPFLAPRAHREWLAACTAVFMASCTVQLPSLLGFFCIRSWRGLW